MKTIPRTIRRAILDKIKPLTQGKTLRREKPSRHDIGSNGDANEAANLFLETCEPEQYPNSLDLYGKHLQLQKLCTLVNDEGPALQWSTAMSKETLTDHKSWQELLDFKFETSSQLSFEEEVKKDPCLQMSPFEDDLDHQETPEPERKGFRSTVYDKCRQLFATYSTMSEEDWQSIGQKYNPVWLQIPLTEGPQENYKKLNLLLFEPPEQGEDTRIQFSQFADVLVYNGNYETKIDGGRNQYCNLASRNRSKDFFKSYSFNKTGSILKNKFNLNYEFEALLLRLLDKIH